MERFERDLLVLSYLRQNARMKLTEMSKESRIPVSTLFDMIRSFEMKGVISKLTSLVKFERLGYRGRAIVVLAACRADRQRLQELLEGNRNVNSLYRVNSGWDFMVELVFPGIKEVEDFIEDLEEGFQLKDKKVFYVIDEIMKENFMANPKAVEMLGVIA
jgi:DNA-binding Lrp family transcriptional regulator